ncbi:cobalt-precorrin-6A reductase [Chlorogloeopsis fritschii PCC 9212]|uniref:Cobalt-precorrin-6A reductase n=1 Tax=Chlorogloeopsis fritschii PCC 6912 TaxID=211165 RepID=A0A433NNK8_CHLFR|nr:cobalt-precorrin-6A reductase [Chlorogloeopsis fritschii]MBF2009145.1 cobalt-precorrin-6A reductase [Chlorogloeopsis fritschii C42_A2020_084]RUR84944.1 cobalt-precorrin-6A reductase [Chlorogloeopsis fritschii PCC 6912]
MRRVWLIGGTAESAVLAKAIAHSQIHCVVSVTTEAARLLYPNVATLQVWVGHLNFTNFDEFLYQQQITAVLDASHPYAVEISQGAIAVCQKLQIPYLRYERPVLEEGEGRGNIYLDSFNTLICGNYLENQRVLLTVGYRQLHLFQPWQGKAALFARLLPSGTALEAAFKAGFTPDRIICLRPPISIDLEKALWRQWNISLVVTKSSGKAGGEDVKQKVAAELGVSLVVINRPEITYPQQTSDLAVALEFCCKHVLCT